MAAGVTASAAEQAPDPAVLADLAARVGLGAWRDANRAQGLPRPLYLRGVNITLPDGARRTVDLE
jgi:tRNA threonylcarbamoyladenosine biosynthesis protein TsaB